MDMHATRMNITGKIQCWSKAAALKRTLGSFPNPERALYIHVIRTLESNERDDKWTRKVQAHTKAYKRLTAEICDCSQCSFFSAHI